jgi:hypothetical protein
MICPECKGKRWKIKTDIMNATTSKERCEFCKGVGEIQDKKPSGLTVKPEAGQLLYFQWVEDARVKSVMTVCIEGIVPPNSPKDKYFIVKIMNMKTPKKHQGKGYMGKVLEGVKKFAQEQVKYMVTSWYDSSKSGKNYLMKRGFVREKNILIWRRDGKPKDDGAPKRKAGIKDTGGGSENGQDNRGGDKGNKE